MKEGTKWKIERKSKWTDREGDRAHIQLCRAYLDEERERERDQSCVNISQIEGWVVCVCVYVWMRVCKCVGVCCCPLQIKERTKNISVVMHSLSHFLLRSFHPPLSLSLSLSLSLFGESFCVPKSPVHSWYPPTLVVCLSVFLSHFPLSLSCVCLSLCLCVCQQVAMYLTWLVQYPAVSLSLSTFYQKPLSQYMP